MADEKSIRGIEGKVGMPSRRAQPAWPLPVAIAAGGRGTRLRPFTDSVPKALVEVNGTSIIDRVVAQFRAQGCDEFWVTTGYRASQISEHFEASGCGCEVHCVDYGGLKGSTTWLRTLRGALRSPFILSACDVLVDFDYPSAYRRHVERGDDITLVAYRHCRVIPAGAIEVAEDGSFGGFGPRREVNELLYAGVCVVGSKALPLLGCEGPLDLPDLVKRCVDADLRVGVETVGEDAFLDMGTFGALARMSRELKKVEGDRTVAR